MGQNSIIVLYFQLNSFTRTRRAKWFASSDVQFFPTNRSIRVIEILELITVSLRNNLLLWNGFAAKIRLAAENQISKLHFLPETSVHDDSQLRYVSLPRNGVAGLPQIHDFSDTVSYPPPWNDTTCFREFPIRCTSSVFSNSFRSPVFRAFRSLHIFPREKFSLFYPSNRGSCPTKHSADFLAPKSSIRVIIA